MKLRITVTFLPEKENSECVLGRIDFVEVHGMPRATWEAPPTQFTLFDGTQIQVSASHSPTNSGTSLVVCQGQKQVALVLTNWEKGNPYLGIQIGQLGFLHLYCQKE
jgi:hypothetical protein